MGLCELRDIPRSLKHSDGDKSPKIFKGETSGNPMPSKLDEQIKRLTDRKAKQEKIAEHKKSIERSKAELKKLRGK